VITGFNTDIPFEGVTYHVQTEDKGIDTPLILSLVYVGGAIIASKRTPYEDLLSKGFDEKVLTERLQRQHKLICAAIKAGRVDDLKRMGGAHANGEAAAETEGAQATAGAGKAAGSRRKKAAAAQPRVETGAAVEDKTTEDKKAVEDKSVEDKPRKDSGKDKAVVEKTVEREKAAVEESKPAPAREVVENREDSGRVAPLDFGADFLTNLVDEISALGEARERAAKPAESPAPVQVPEAEADEESPFAIVPSPSLTDEPEPLLVEPLPFAFAGAPNAVEPEPPEELYLSLLDDEGDFRAGQLATIKVHVGRGAYGRSPVAGAAVTVKVLGTTFRPLILTTDTDERGLAIIRALLPRFNSGRAALIIRATSGEEFSELRRIIHQ
jgi:hypothetical protein